MEIRVKKKKTLNLYRDLGQVAPIFAESKRTNMWFNNLEL